MLDMPEVPAVTILTSNDFMGWLAGARPGERCVYFRGFLAKWRGELSDKNRALTSAEREQEMLADVAWGMYGAGKVALVQRRIGAGDYVYFAERRRTSAA